MQLWVNPPPPQLCSCSITGINMQLLAFQLQRAVREQWCVIESLSAAASSASGFSWGGGSCMGVLCSARLCNHMAHASGANSHFYAVVSSSKLWPRRCVSQEFSAVSRPAPYLCWTGWGRGLGGCRRAMWLTFCPFPVFSCPLRGWVCFRGRGGGAVRVPGGHVGHPGRCPSPCRSKTGVNAL